MLSLKQITKDYVVGDSIVRALKDVSINFRENEFVSILGPSGCGKTTLLNIVGGLDKYTSGDLFISGVSTNDYKDRDWDVYRNHRIGFIFQSYNLIPHQTVLQNVELALTIAGLGKSERARRAKDALDTVGLKGQYNKRPNQLSGGQCQRVAIARALVNEPEILLADEPTGALDTETSVQIMELIKEIAAKRLVIMVTHNPELADKYSTRIIQLLDGEIVGDSNPFSDEEEKAEIARIYDENRGISVEEAVTTEPVADGGNKHEKHNGKEKARMSWWTAMKLSSKNLLAKKKRTALTSFAGSIGIIGISMVLSLSYGIQAFIDGMQNDMLSGNPITISQSAYDINALMQQTTESEKIKALVSEGYVNVDSTVAYLVKRAEEITNIMVENTITPEYVSYVEKIEDNYDAMVRLNYGLNLSNNLYLDFLRDSESETEKISISGILSKYSSVLKETDFGEYSSYISELSSAFRQAPSNSDYVLTQYDLLQGSVSAEANEIMIVVNDDTELTDLLLAELGYYSEEEFLNIVYRETDDERYDASLDKKSFSYEELIGRKFMWYPNDVVFTENTDDSTSANFPYHYNAYADDSFTDGVELTISGILKPKDTISYGCLSTGFYYTEALAEYIIADGIQSDFVKKLYRIGELDESDSYTGVMVSGAPVKGIFYTYTYDYYDDNKNWVTSDATYACIGSTNQMSMMGMMGMGGGSNTETYTLSMQEVGGVSMPTSISIYPISFEEKDKVLSYLDAWNGEDDIIIDDMIYPDGAREKITYTDNLSLVIDIINTLVKVITYALIAFTALSLIVSCVMIAVTTYISIAERTKEIGVIRSLGGRKRDVSALFNAETLVTGLISGVFGIIVTYILTAILNLIVSALAGIHTIAIFPWHYALIMISVSTVLTVISGLIPAKSAAKKDPVVALRTE